MFSESTVIDLPDANLIYYPNWLDQQTAFDLLSLFQERLTWQQQPIRMFGRWVMQPRLTAWYGDRGAIYTYSGLRHEPLEWLPELKDMRDRLQEETGYPFNSVLCNAYRSGADSMGWHSDDEPELGINPVIASVSLGHVRRFALRHKTQPNHRYNLELENGSLLLMQGATQHHWQHSLPRTTRSVKLRINLTFRQIQIQT